MNQASSAQTEVAAPVWSAMNAFATAANDRKRELQEALGLGRGTGRVKALLLLLNGPTTLPDIAAANQIGARYATLIVKQLVSLGLAERTDHPDDLRRKPVKITEAGHEAAEHAKRIFSQPPAGLATLAPADPDLLEQALRQLVVPLANEPLPSGH